MQKAAGSTELKKAFETHLRQTENQIKRLEQVFEEMGSNASRKHCKGIKGLIEESDEILKEHKDKDVMDAGLIVAAQKVEHYEMAGYGSARTHARQLGMNRVADLLQQTLDEEGQTDHKLTQLAEQVVNPKAQM